VAFFQKVQLVFPISKIKIFQITILSLKFELVVYCYWQVKFQVQESDLEYFLWEIWRFEKHITLSEKSHLYH